jgi:phospholipase/carboxylesterase
MTHDTHAHENPLISGVPLRTAPYALVLVHGRGGSADGMLPIARAAGATDAALVAPRAADGSWYPNRFLDPMDSNEPFLTSALASIDRTVRDIIASGIPAERVLLVGFSQGACLSLEYATRHAQRFGGVAALAGALIGDAHDTRDGDRQYMGDFAGTPVFLGCGDADSHIPEARVRASAALLEQRGATVDLRIYPDIGHNIVGDQLDALRAMVAVVRESAATRTTG